MKIRETNLIFNRKVDITVFHGAFSCLIVKELFIPSNGAFVLRVFMIGVSPVG